MNHPEFVDERSSRYASAMGVAPRAREMELRALRAVLSGLQIANCRQIIDLGAGHGFATLCLTEYLSRGGQVLGVDNSANMLEQIPFHPRIRTVVSALDNIELPSESAELAVSVATFHHITHKTIVLREISRLLAPGGFLVIADVLHDSAPQKFFDNVVRKHCITGHDWDFLDGEWVSLLATRTLLKHCETSIADTDWEFQSEAEMLCFMRDLLGLSLDLEALKPLVNRWLRPARIEGSSHVRLPWSLGFHVLRKNKQFEE